MMKNIPLLILFIIGIPWLMVYSLQLAQTSNQNIISQTFNHLSPELEFSGARVFAALPEDLGETSYTIDSADARHAILQNYLSGLDTPLSGYVDEIIKSADTYKIDFRLLVAIARQESNLCKYIPPEGHNCWGWGIHERGTLGFDSYPDAIWTVSQGIREKYLDDGLHSPEEIMSRYTPSSPGTWAMAVNQFMKEME